jgi:hypothetical protein
MEQRAFSFALLPAIWLIKKLGLNLDKPLGKAFCRQIIMIGVRGAKSPWKCNGAENVSLSLWILKSAW